MTGHAPTGEQSAIIAAYRSATNLVIEAGAGTGKTSTMRLCAEARPRIRMVYLSYNRAIADEAGRTFPANVQCSTAHSLAMRAVGRQYRHRLDGPRVPAQQAARILRINDPVRLGDLILAPQQIARVALETVQRYCKSGDAEISAWHVPRKPGLDEPSVHRALAAEVLPLARRAWEDLMAPAGQLKFTHDAYLKAWGLTGPQLDADAVMLDEAQDANGVILGVVLAQRAAQLVAVGDRNQAINGWNLAIDAMDKFPDAQRLALSQSFRFGSQIAREANKWLQILGADLRLKGFQRISSMIGTCERPHAILCRTNARATVEAMQLLEAGVATAMVGSLAKEIRALAEAAEQLQAGRGTSHPELFAFQNWAQVRDHAENDPGGSDLRVLVSLIDEHSPRKIIGMVDSLADEKRAQVTVSTAHRAKGREWGSVRIATDFREPRPDPKAPDAVPEVAAETAMLAYVAVTRAQLHLDREGLAWVDKFLVSGAAA